MVKKTECKEPEKKQNTIDDEALDNVAMGGCCPDEGGETKLYRNNK